MLNLSAFALLASGCRDSVGPQPISSNRTTSASGDAVDVLEERAVGQRLDDAFARVAGAVPSFAGAYFRGDTMVIRSTTLSDSSSLAAALLAEWRARVATDRRTPAAVTAKLGQFPTLHRFEEAAVTFAVLNQWRKELSSPLFAIAGAVSLDVDERLGMIDIGVESLLTESLVRQIALLRTIPEAAFRIRVVEPVKINRQTLTLTSRRRPLTGGYELNVTLGGVCTMTTTVWRGVEALILTASHCTRSRFALDNWSISQGNAGDTFGYEATDPSRYSCGTFFQPRLCRHADVAAYGLGTPTVYSEDTATFVAGLVGRTTQAVPGANMTVGTLEIDTSSPHFTLLASVYQPYVGQVVHKVGKVGGWTYGEVYQTCVDLRQQETGTLIVCADKAQLFSRPGDSGAPVFMIDAYQPTLAYFVGILWGNDGGASGLFSNLGQIRRDLGDIRFAY